MRSSAADLATANGVSIRTRPFGRVMRILSPSNSCAMRSFNPHPAFRPGDALNRDIFDGRGLCFNPHPAFRPGDAMESWSRAATSDQFQSAPGLSAG